MAHDRIPFAVTYQDQEGLGLYASEELRPIKSSSGISNNNLQIVVGSPLREVH